MVSMATIEMEQLRQTPAQIRQGLNEPAPKPRRRTVPQTATDQIERSRKADSRLARSTRPIAVGDDEFAPSSNTLTADGLIELPERLEARAFALGLCPQLADNDPLGMTSYPSNDRPRWTPPNKPK